MFQFEMKWVRISHHIITILYICWHYFLKIFIKKVSVKGWNYSSFSLKLQSNWIQHNFNRFMKNENPQKVLYIYLRYATFHEKIIFFSNRVSSRQSLIAFSVAQKYLRTNSETSHYCIFTHFSFFTLWFQ